MERDLHAKVEELERRIAHVEHYLKQATVTPQPRAMLTTRGFVSYRDATHGDRWGDEH